MRRPILSSILFALLMPFAAGAGSICAAQPARIITNRNSGSNTLELAPRLPSSQSTPGLAPQNSNVREIPVIPPSQKVLVLPQASRDFLGRWGGHLFLTRRYGRLNPPAETGMSLDFGQRNGQVVMATYVYAGPTSQILKTIIDSSGPRSVSFKVAGLTLGGTRPLRHIERVSLTLVGRNQIECDKHVDIYAAGLPDPILEAVYKGKLHPISAAEGRLMALEAERAGEVPQRKIEKGNPPPLP